VALQLTLKEKEDRKKMGKLKQNIENLFRPFFEDNTS
jgi:hypothetical protein